jgi:hypothetical protein
VLACVLAILARVKITGVPADKALKLETWIVEYVDVLTLEALVRVQVSVFPLATVIPEIALQGIMLPEASPVPRSAGHRRFSKLSCVGN